MSDTITHFIVKGTFGLLLFGSVITWALVLLKARQRWVTKSQDRRFFAAAPAPLKVATLKALEGQRGPAWRVVRSGLVAVADSERERVGLDGGAEGGETLREAVERALGAQIERERRAAEGGLAVLASIGTTAPFVGLFGTVWGIIHALRAIGSSGSASLEVVAGPIGEALVATGIGIAVAVPAVLAYNFFLRRLKVHASDLVQLAAAFVGAAARHQPAPLRVERSAVFEEPRREARL